MGLKLSVIHNNQVIMINLPFNLINHFVVSMVLFSWPIHIVLPIKSSYLNDINSIITVTSYIQKLYPEEEQAVS